MRLLLGLCWALTQQVGHYAGKRVARGFADPGHYLPAVGKIGHMQWLRKTEQGRRTDDDKVVLLPGLINDFPENSPSPISEAVRDRPGGKDLQRWEVGR